MRSPDGVVYTEASLLVCTEDKSATELVVEVAEGDIDTFPCLELSIEIRYAPPLEIRFETWQRILGELQSGSNLKTRVGNVDVGISIGEHIFFICTRTYLIILLGHEDVALYASVHRNLVTVLRPCLSCGHSCHEDGSRKKL